MQVGEVSLSNGRTYRIERLDTGTRTASAKVDGDTIVIKIPRMLRGEAGGRMFARLKQRIVSALEAHPERFEKHTLTFHDSEELMVGGRHFVVRIEQRDRPYSSAKVDGEEVVVRLPVSVEDSDKEGIVTRLVVRALSREFMPTITGRIDEINRLHFNSEISNVTIRNNTSRWGSYSRKSKKISINFKLLYAPAEVIDYVIVHELSHTRVTSHSARFWRVVEGVIPDYKERRKWLRKNGDFLGKGNRTATVS
jgi:predicted metal-dependent hydrolase